MSDAIAAVQMVYTGRVQGIGLRPAIARFANRLQLCGHVVNTRQGIVVRIEGPATQIDRFICELEQHLPSSASLKIVSRAATIATGVRSFSILQHAGPVAVTAAIISWRTF
ncbi:MAG: hypothetical protein FJ295_17420 [Planctomycetes bacterium]|nr:hypothetical protein [Planctomycetota bacterium]